MLYAFLWNMLAFATAGVRLRKCFAEAHLRNFSFWLIWHRLLPVLPRCIRSLSPCGRIRSAARLRNLKRSLSRSRWLPITRNLSSTCISFRHLRVVDTTTNYE
jgi:hypothetical protein